ncbi:MAG: hypothetical protein ABSB23_07065, partial [Bryobacteraceae bacterium]
MPTFLRLRRPLGPACPVAGASVFCEWCRSAGGLLPVRDQDICDKRYQDICDIGLGFPTIGSFVKMKPSRAEDRA